MRSHYNNSHHKQIKTEQQGFLQDRASARQREVGVDQSPQAHHDKTPAYLAYVLT